MDDRLRAMRPHCEALKDYWAGSFDSPLSIVRSDGYEDEIPVHAVFSPEAFPGDRAALQRCRDLLTPEGLVIADSLDVRTTSKPHHLDYQKSLEREGRYRGEMRCRLRYRNRRGAEFGWVHVDGDTLSDVATAAGLDAEILHREDDGNYVAALTRSAPGP